MAAISTSRKAQGLTLLTENSLLKKAIKGCKRKYGTVKKKYEAATVNVIRYLLIIPQECLRPSNFTVLGFKGAFRCLELCALNIENLK